MAAPLHRLPFDVVDDYLADRYPADLVVPEGCVYAPTRALALPTLFGAVTIYRPHLGDRHVSRLIGPVPGYSDGQGGKIARTVTRRTVGRWRAEGVSVWLADRIASALGLPADDGQLWGRAWADAVDDTIDRWVVAGPRSSEPPKVSAQHPARPRKLVAA